MNAAMAAGVTYDDPQRQALYARMARRYPLRSRQFAVADLQLEILTVADPDRVLLESERGIEQTGAGDDPRWQPYWAEAWASAVVVGETLAPRDLSGQNVLDLGCGVGLAGTVAAARGASVVLADAAPPSLLFARWNAWPWRDRVHTRRVDWRTDRIAEAPFDLILGADILYDRRDWPYLNTFWRAHLAPRGELLLVEPGRSISDGFAEWSRSAGWLLAHDTVLVPGQPRPYRRYRLSLGGGPVAPDATC